MSAEAVVQFGDQSRGGYVDRTPPQDLPARASANKLARSLAASSSSDGQTSLKNGAYVRTASSRDISHCQFSC